MANPQTDNGFVRIANEIWDELIRRDFTKRQKDIIQLIWRLSYGCRKKAAHIPLLKDFEVCGVGPTNVTKELNYLLQCRVIHWEKDTMIFAVNKDYERWQVNPVRGWDEEKFKKLIHLNIDKKTYQNDKFIPEKTKPKVTITYQNNKCKLIKTISLHLLKREVRLPSNPCRCKAKRVSKDSIKDIITDSSSNKELKAPAPPASLVIDFSFARIYQAYEKNFTKGDKVTDFDIEELNILFDDYGGEWLLEGMKEAARHGRKTLAYVHGILKGYKSRGGPMKDNQTERPPEPLNPILDPNDPITKLMLSVGDHQRAQYGSS